MKRFHLPTWRIFCSFSRALSRGRGVSASNIPFSACRNRNKIYKLKGVFSWRDILLYGAVCSFRLICAGLCPCGCWMNTFLFSGVSASHYGECLHYWPMTKKQGMRSRRQHGADLKRYAAGCLNLLCGPCMFAVYLKNRRRREKPPAYYKQGQSKGRWLIWQRRAEGRKT